MKKQFSILSIAAIGTVIALTSCGPTSHVEVAKGVNFSNYKTFGWVNDNTTTAGRADNAIIDNNIKNSISTDLEKEGWQETTQQPDVLVDYNVVVTKGVTQQTEPVYNNFYSGYYYNSWRGRGRMGYYYNPDFFRGYRTYNVPFKTGTLTVNMVDAKTNKLIWQGSAQGDISTTEITSGNVKADVKSIFKKFNLPKINSTASAY
jgi:hypothetical protein